MSCPFYGASLGGGGQGLAPSVTAHLVVLGESNRCALITSAHSPCWMEVAEVKAPEWGKCWRNPEYLAAPDGDLVGLVRYLGWMHRLARVEERG
jgi:hypothetical protein